MNWIRIFYQNSAIGTATRLIQSWIVQKNMFQVQSVMCRILCESVVFSVQCSGEERVPSGQPAAPVSLFLISLHLSHSLKCYLIHSKGTFAEMQKWGVRWGETISRFHVPAIKASDAVENLLPVQSLRYHFRAPQPQKLRNARHSQSSSTCTVLNRDKEMKVLIC